MISDVCDNTNIETLFLLLLFVSSRCSLRSLPNNLPPPTVFSGPGRGDTPPPPAIIESEEEDDVSSMESLAKPPLLLPLMPMVRRNRLRCGRWSPPTLDRPRGDPPPPPRLNLSSSGDEIRLRLIGCRTGVGNLVGFVLVGVDDVEGFFPGGTGLLLWKSNAYNLTFILNQLFTS